MSKGYKVWMFVLLGVGALFVLASIGGFSLGDTAAAFVTLILGLAIALPMLLLYKPLAEKRRKELRRQKRKQEAAARRAAEKKAAADRAAEEQKRAEAARIKKVSFDLANVNQPRVKARYYDEKGNYSHVARFHSYHDGHDLLYAVVSDNEKIGDLVDIDAEEMLETLKTYEIRRALLSYDTDFDAGVGDVVFTASVDVEFYPRDVL